MSHTFSVKLLNSISCSPSPCTGRYPARTTMGTPLPCRIFIGLKPNSLAAFRFRQSPFKNLTTVWRDRLSDTTFVLYCLWQLPCGQFMLRLLSLISVVPQCDVYNYLPSPPKDTTARTIVQPMQALSLYLSFLLAIQSQHDSWLTYGFTAMLHSLSGFPFR